MRSCPELKLPHLARSEAARTARDGEKWDFAFVPDALLEWRLLAGTDIPGSHVCHRRLTEVGPLADRLLSGAANCESDIR